METIRIVLDIIIIGIAAFFIISKSYLNEKGKNLATKEDIKDITNKIESVKREYQRKTEIDKKEIELNHELYDKLSNLHNTFRELDQMLTNNTFKQEYIEKYNFIFSDLQRLLISHKNTYYLKYEDKFKKLENVANSFIQALRESNTDKYRESGKRLLDIADSIRIDIFNFLKN